MRSRIYSMLTRSVLICLSMTFMASAHAQKVVVQEAIPNTAEQGTVNLDVEIKGRGFASGANVAFWVTGSTNPGGITVKSVTVHGSKSLTANIDVEADADVDDFDIEVSLLSGRKGRGTTLFSVEQKGGQTTDTTDPAMITDLRTAAYTSDQMRLRWTSPGDDGNVGDVDHQDQRMKAQGSTCPADPAYYDFSGAVTTTRGSTPAGRAIEDTIRGLEPETCYAFEVQPFDEAGNTPGPSYATGTTTAATAAGLWSVEVLPLTIYRKALAFDPVTHEPVVLGSQHKGGTYYFTRSLNGTWSYQSVQRANGENYVALELNPFGKFEAVVQKRGNPQYAQLQGNGSWDISQVQGDSVEFTNQALSFDADGYAGIVYSNDSLIHLARYNGSSFDIETLPSHIPAGRGPILQFNSDGDPVIAYHNFDGDIFLATQDVSGWNYETVASRPDVYTVMSFHFDPNGEPVVMYREGLVTRYDRFIIMARRDGAGGWTAMTIDPTGAPHQGAVLDMAYTADGNLYLTMSNLGGEARVGRFCEDRPGVAISCVPTTDINGNNVWLWENAANEGGGGWSIAINPYDGTVAVVTSGESAEYGNTARYIRCNPNAVPASVICGNQ